MSERVAYAGFWRRFAASLIDTVLLMALLVPLLYVVFGRDYFQISLTTEVPATQAGLMRLLDFLINNVLPMVLVVALWVKFGATPGKALLGCHIVDARTGRTPGVGQAIVRYLGYIVSTLPLCLGFLWIAWDPRKQGFHDKIANTYVIYRPRDEADKSLEELIKEGS